MAIITPSITAPDHADNSKNQEAVYIIPQTQTELIAHLDMRPVVLPDTLPSPMLETILTPDNLHHYTPNHLVDAYYQGKVEIQCVDGRSVQRNDKLVIHTPGGEIALYGQLLKTLDELTHDTQVMERLWNKFLMRPLGTTPRGEGVYAHSDTHGTPVSEAHDSAHDDHHHKVYAYGVGNNHADFQCGCGHCNLIMKNDVYGYTDNEKQLLNALYPAHPDKLAGDHLEGAIVIQEANDDGSLSSLRSNALGSDQVFSYDVVAVKHLMQTLSNELSDLAQQEGISLSADQIFDRWNAIHDHDTTQTVHKQLKPAVKLVTEGKVYMTHMNNGQLMCHQ